VESAVSGGSQDGWEKISNNNNDGLLFKELEEPSNKDEL